MLRNVKKLVSALLVIILMGNGLPIHVWAENHETTDQEQIINDKINWFEESAEDTELLANKIKNDEGLETQESQEIKTEESYLQTTGTEGLYEYAEVQGGVAIIKYNSKGNGSLVIPSILNGKQVVMLGERSFSGCYNITSVTIPEGVKTIEKSAFSSCYRIANVTFPNTLISIGTDAFWNCDLLNTVNIPEGVTSIGVQAFSSCEYLDTVNLPDSLKTLGPGAFSQGGLKSITIGSGITEIQEHTFFACDNLTSISLPDSVKKIGPSAYMSCDGLTEVRIPSGVTSIGESAFRFCHRLTKAVIPAGVASIDKYVFEECDSLKSVQFNSPTTIINADYGWDETIPGGTTVIGHNPSTAKDYANRYQNPFQLISETPDELDIMVPSNTQIIVVKDFDTKQPITRVAVSFAGKSVTTDIEGLAKISTTATGNQLLSMSMPGYCTYQSNLMVSLGKANVFYLRKEDSYTKPQISMVNLLDSEGYHDLLREEMTYVKSESEDCGNSDDPSGGGGDCAFSDDEYCNIEIRANWKGKTPKRYYLTQNEKIVLENISGVFENVVPGALFEPGCRIYALVEAEDGTVTKAAEVGLQIKAKKLSGALFGGDDNNCELSIGSKVGLTVPGNIPVLSGAEIEGGFDFVSATFSVTPDTFKIALGVEGLLDTEDKDKPSKEEWSKFKKDIADARKYPENANQLKNIKDYFKPKEIGMPIKSDWKPEADLVGYIEGTIVDGQPVITSSTILVKLGASYSSQTQYVVGPVPVYVEVGGGVEMELMGEIAKIAPETGELQISTELTVTPNFELGGGIGIANVLTVGASGKAELAFLSRYFDKYTNISLTGSMYLEAKALIFKAKTEIAKGTWTLYDGYGNSQTINSAALQNDESNFNIYDAGQYSLMSRDYAQNPSSWNGDGGISAMAANYTNQTLKVLQTNLYPNAQPKMAVIGDKPVMIWIDDSSSRSDANRTMLVYSIFDQESGSWSAPVAVADDGTADFYPQIASDGNSLYVVWQNSKTIFSEVVTLGDAAKAGEIAVAKLNSASYTFDASTILTGNETMDTQPQVAVSGDKAAVVWTTNSENDLFGITGRNTIQCSELSGALWTAPQTLVSDQNVIPSLCVGYSDNLATVAFTVDSDNNLGTIDDRDLFTAKSGENVTRLTSDVTMDSNPVFAKMNGTDSLFWYKDRNLVYIPAYEMIATPSTIFGENKPGLGDTFNIVNNAAGKTAAIWTETKDAMTEIHGAIYDEAKSQWSDDIQISNVGSKIQFPNGIFDTSGNFSIAFNRQTAIDDTNRQSDLCALNVIPSYNLTLNWVSVDSGAVIPNTALPIQLEVTNNGQLTVDQTNVIVMEGEVQNASVTLTECIKPGETKTLQASLNLPVTIAKKDYSIKVVPVIGDEYDLNDNVQTVTLGYTDLALRIEKYKVGDDRVIMAQVKNLSAVPTDATIKVTEDTAEGKVLFTKTIKDVKQNENRFETVDLDPKNLTFTDDIKQIYVSVTSGAEEFSTGDNSDFIVLDNPVQPATLQSIAITTPATKLSYKIGEQLDLTGLVVTGTYSDATTKAETITADTVTGFNSSVAAADQLLTITVNGKTVTYNVQIATTILIGDVDGNAKVQAYDALMALQIATGKKVGSAAEINAADVGKSGKVEVFDALRILQYVIGKITVF